MSEQPWLQPDLLPEHPFPGHWAHLEAGKAVQTTFSELLDKIARGRGRVPFSGDPINTIPVFVAGPDWPRFVPVTDVPALRSEWLRQMAPNFQDNLVRAGMWLPILPMLFVALARNDAHDWIGVAYVFGLLVLPFMFYLAGRYERRSEARWADSLRETFLFQFWNSTRPKGQTSRAVWLQLGWALVLASQWLAARLQPSREGAFAIASAALDPQLWRTEPWRLLTAPMLHVNLFHLIGNVLLAATVLWVLDVTRYRYWGMRIWLLGAFAGSLLSAPIGNASSVGASGGVMALLVFLLTLAVRNLGSFPRFLLRNLLFNLFLIVALGVIAWEFIDNAAHVGGGLTGLALAIYLHPKGAPIWGGGRVDSPPLWSKVADVGFLALTLLTVTALLAPLW